MLTPHRTMMLAAGLLVACGGDDVPLPDDDPALAGRVVAALAGDPDALPGDLGEADATCPAVDDPQEGDSATCTLRFEQGGTVEVDIEFESDGTFTVVALIPVG